MSRPEPINLSTEEGEAIMARLSVYAPNIGTDLRNRHWAFDALRS
jgi:hypothetical protein